jgi:hypothetical protein
MQCASMERGEGRDTEKAERLLQAANRSRSRTSSDLNRGRAWLALEHATSPSITSNCAQSGRALRGVMC